MRWPFALSLFAALVAIVLSGTLVDAAAAPPAAPQPIAMTQQPPIDDNDDTRVEVQLIVAGIAAFTVVGVGSAAYMLRRKLGRIAPPPGDGASSHH